ncbi:GNAT family N-acetyltransferase, partial [Acinetobacter baumannii]|nr:GNAT family N-acetyltransferase [Acinetobacter baumannii]
MNYSLDSNFRLIDCNEAEHAVAILEI